MAPLLAVVVPQQLASVDPVPQQPATSSIGSASSARVGLARVTAEAAAAFLKVHGVARRDEVEQLREDFNGFFISAPNGVIHLVVGPEEV